MSLLRTPPAHSVAGSGSGGGDRPRRGRPPARNEILRAGRLGGVDPDQLALEYGTPLYAYDLDVVTRQVEALRSALPGRFEIAYAVKANPSLGVVAHLGAQEIGADVASLGELRTALRAGIPAGRIVMTGPGKRDEELRSAVEAGIRAITVESPGELRRLERIAADRSPSRPAVPVLLRSAMPAARALERVRLVGDDGAGKFGMDRSDLAEAARAAAASTTLELLGIHAFGASNVTDASALAAHVEETLELASEVARTAGTSFSLVDVGGGLGIPYESGDESLDLVGFGRLLQAIAGRWAADPGIGAARVLLEPGRFLVGPAGAYVARVVDRKTVDGRAIAILDGGIHHVLRPVLVGQEHRVRRLTGRSGVDGTARFAPVTIAGPLCSGLDVFATEAMLQPPEPGDLVAVLDVGAYGFTESMPFFLSHALPAEVALRGGRATLLRPRLEPETWLDWQRLP